MKKFIIYITILAFVSCGGSNNSNKPTETTVDNSVERSISTSQEPNSSTSSPSDKDAYEVIEGVFEGSPSKSQVQPMIEAVMNRYGMTITNEHTMNVANMLFVLKKESKVGVTEMEILKHIYQHGSSSVTLPEQAAISSVYLEQNK